MTTYTGVMLDEGGAVYNVNTFGAAGDGVTDDREAIQAAIDAASANGGGIVYLPPGTYLLASVVTPPAPATTDWHMLTPRDRVSIVGAGAPSILKVASGMVSGTTTFEVFVGQGLQDASFRDFVIDLNGTQNLLPAPAPGQPPYYCTAFRLPSQPLQATTNVEFANLAILNAPGSQMISVAINDYRHPLPQQISIRRCKFHNFGHAVPGNEHQGDHSAIYLQAERSAIEDNDFWNDALPCITNVTAIEVHTSHSIVRGNRGWNLGTAANFVAFSSDFVQNLVVDNVFYNTRIGFYYWPYSPPELGKVFRGNVFRSNDIALAASTADATYVYGAFFPAPTTVQNEVFDLEVDSNRFWQLGAVTLSPGIVLRNAVRARVSRNVVQDLGGDGIRVYQDNLKSSARVTLENNRVIDCGRASTSGWKGIDIEAANQIYTVSLRGNETFGHAGTAPTVGLRLQGPIPGVFGGDNHFDAVTPIAKSGWSGGTYMLVETHSGIVRIPGVLKAASGAGGIVKMNAAVGVSSGAVPTLADGQSHTFAEIVVPGAALGDPVLVGYTGLAGGAGWMVSGYVSNSDKVRVTILNRTGASASIPNGYFATTVLGVA